MAKQGKCHECQVRYTWDGDAPFHRLECPECKGYLRPTSYLSLYTLVVLEDPPYRRPEDNR